MNQRALSCVALAALVSACGGAAEPAVAPGPAPVTTMAAPPAPSVAAPVATASGPAALPPKPALVELQKRALDQLLDAFNRHDAKGVAALYAETGAIESPAPEGWHAMRGRSAIEAEHAGLFAAFPDLKLAVTRVFASGHTVAYEWVTRGTNTGAFMGAPATGKVVGFQAASLLTFDDDGFISLDHTYIDDVTIAVELGLAPGKTRPMPAMPSAPPVWTQASASPEETALAESARKNWPELWSKKDTKGYESAFTPNAIHREIASPNDFSGKQALMAEYKLYATSVPDMHVEVDRLFTAGRFAVLEFTFAGTQKGPLGPLKATGKPFTIHGLDIDAFDGARYSEANTYSNAREFLTQLGAIPSAPPPH